jgi:transmembrane sensor
MTNRNNKKADELLERFLRDACTPEEQALVARWYEGIELDQQNTEDWAAASKASFLEQHAPVLQKRRKLVPLKWIAAAALIFIIAGAGFYFSNTASLNNTIPAPDYAAVTGPAALKQILLPDSTVVWLNANSQLHWSGDYKKGKRYVTLQGEASFDVHHDAAHPFVVHTPDADIKVLGTCFNVATDNPDATTQIALLRGKVAVKLNNQGNQNLVLAPGEIATCSVSGKLLKKYNADVQSAFSWMNGGFYAHDMPLKQVLEKLCTKYGYILQWQDERGGHKHISVAFSAQGFSSMLESLCFVNHLHYSIHNHNIVIQ